MTKNNKSKSMIEDIPQALLKFCRPQLAAIFPRKRLFHVLENMSWQQLIWVCGPGGSGKTTLISSYLETLKINYLWYHIDQGDFDLASFFHYLGMAVKKKALPDTDISFPVFTFEYQRSIAEFSRNFFEKIFYAFDEPITFVFDDLHEISEDAPIYQALLEGLTRLPEGFRMILISRTQPVPALIRLRANRGLTLLDWNDLRLTREEFDSILGSKKIQFTEKTRTELYQIIDGWVAGLQLLLETNTNDLKNLAKIDFNSGNLTLPKAFFDYFCRQIFSRLDNETQRFLFTTSLLPVMTASMAQTLSGIPHAISLLDDFCQRNLFIEKLLFPTPSYRYHPILRSCLMEHANSFFNHDELCELRRSAGRLLLEAEQLESAGNLFEQAKDWDDLNAMVMELSPSLLKQGRNKIILNWLDHLPDEWVNNSPWMLFWQGSSLLPFDPFKAKILFIRAFGLFHSGQQDKMGELLAGTGILQAIELAFSNLHEMDEFLEKIFQIASSPKEIPNTAVGICIISRIYATLAIRFPSHKNFNEWEQRALVLEKNSEDIPCRTQILYHALFRQCCMDELLKAEQTLSAIQQIGLENQDPLTQLISFYCNIFYKNMSGYELHRIPQILNEALDLAKKSGVHLFDGMLFYEGIRNAFLVGDLINATRLTQQFSEIHAHLDPLSCAAYNTIAAVLAMFENRVQDASGHADRALYYAQQVGVPYAEAHNLCIKALVLHAQGYTKQAVEWLERASKKYEKAVTTYIEFDLMLCKALFLLESNCVHEGLITLRQALELGIKKNHQTPYLFILPRLANLLVIAIENDIESEYARLLIEVCHLVPDPSPVTLEKWSWPLRIYTLGYFELVRNNKPISFSTKSQQKPLELLKVLISLGGREVSESQLADILWPNAEGDLSHTAFKTTLHRLRRLIGIDNTLVLRSNRLTLNCQNCWLDMWAFEQLINRVNTVTENSSCHYDEVNHLSNQILGLYQGPFLTEQADPSTIFRREHLSVKYKEVIISIGQYLQRQEKYQEAINIFRKGLEIQPLSEEMTRNLMVCQHKMGHIHEALADYHRLKTLLKSSLNLLPSEATELVSQKLIEQLKSPPPS